MNKLNFLKEIDMNTKTLHKLAKQHDLAPEKLDKIELIRSIQRGEGNFDCFAKAYDGYCDQSACLWREDCLSLATQRPRDN